MTADVLEFKAQREEVMTASDHELTPIVTDGLEELYHGNADWYDDMIDAAAVLWWETFEYEQGRTPTPTELAQFQSTCARVLDRTGQPESPTPDPTQVQVVTGWLSAYALNSATAAGGGKNGALEWVTMRDGDVRDIHAPLDGDPSDRRGLFHVAGYRLHFPGEPVGPPHVWINCRCQVRRLDTQGAAMDVKASAHEAPYTDPTEHENDPGENDTGDDEDFDGGENVDLDYAEQGDYTELDSDVAWHGVIAPTGVMSGDRRKFAVNAMRTRDLPVPLTYQKAQQDAHGGAVTVANIERIWEEDGLIKAEGRFAVSPESDEAISLIADRMLRGVSVELDDAIAELQNEDGTTFDMNDETAMPVTVVTDGRVASATLVTVPAFQEAFVSLGTWEEAEAAMGLMAAGSCVPCAAREMDALIEEWEQYAVSDSSWDGSAARFTPEQWYRSTILHRSSDKENKSDHSLPILEPNGDLSRAGVHAAAGRISQTDATPEQQGKARRALLAAYSKLNEDPPESLTASAFEDLVVDEPVEPIILRANGAITTTAENVVWTVNNTSGTSNAATITAAAGTHDGPGWATHPADTQRLRTYWTRGKGAAKIRWGQPGDFNRCRKQLAKYVPNPDYLAGTCANLHKVAIGIWPGTEGGNKASLSAAAAPSFTMVASAAAVQPHEWFEDPHLDGPTPLTVDGDHVYGHIAAWATCHTGYGVSIGDGEVCVRPPNSASNYAYYLVGEVATDAGPRSVGHITLGTGHAGDRMLPRVAAAHYDNTGAVAADVACGEDKHGIWFNGALRPGLQPEDLAALRSAALSGDWRKIAGAYELVAALAVNVPGFPIPRTMITASGGEQVALIAAGVVHEEDRGVDLRLLVREEFAQIRAEESRRIARLEVIDNIRHIRAQHARERLAHIRG